MPYDAHLLLPGGGTALVVSRHCRFLGSSSVQLLRFCGERSIPLRIELRGHAISPMVGFTAESWWTEYDFYYWLVVAMCDVERFRCCQCVEIHEESCIRLLWFRCRA